MVKLPVVSSLKKIECFPTWIPARSHQLLRDTLYHVYHNFKDFSVMSFCLGSYFLGDGEGKVVTEAFYVPFLNYTVINTAENIVASSYISMIKTIPHSMLACPLLFRS